MKTQSTFLAQLNKNEMKVLTTQVEEKLATNNCNKKSFTALDLWSIQKQRKNYGIRSFA